MLPINMNAKETHKHNSTFMGMQIIRLKENKHEINMKGNI